MSNMVSKGFPVQGCWVRQSMGSKTGNDWEMAVPLTTIPMGVPASIVGIAQACQGLERRRLLDLGFVTGSVVMGELVAPGGDPTAYLIRGTLIALRREQAQWIRVIPVASHD